LEIPFNCKIVMARSRALSFEHDLFGKTYPLFSIMLCRRISLHAR
jgi:hypothetical protein